MATLLYRLGKTAFRRWPAFIAGWLVVLIGAGVLAGTVSKPMVDTFSIPGIPSLQAQELQKELFPESADAEDAATVTVVVAAPEGHSLREARYAGQVSRLVADLEQLPQLPKTPLIDPVQAPPKQQALGAEDRIGTISWNYDVDTVAEVLPSTQERLLDILAGARSGGLVVEASGSGVQAMAEIGGASELIGIGIALIVLIITFGSLVAAGLPIVAALVGVGLGVFGISIATAFTTIGTTTPILATMIGLAVGIDYTLFILSRYRTELHHADDREEAVGRAVGTAGSAVVFAGLTVLIALSALSIVGIPFLTSMGLAAAGTVLTAVLVALTLLPAVLGLLKPKAFGGVVRDQRVVRDDAGRIHNGGVRWARLLGRAPVAVVLVVVVGLGALALPIGGLHLALPTDSTSPTDTTQRKASDLISKAFGPGRQAPLLVVVDGRETPKAEREAAYADVAGWAGDLSGVADARVVATNQAGTGAQVLVTPTGGPDDQSTVDLLEAMREGQSSVEESTGTTVGVTGVTAIQADVSARLTDALPTYLAVVIGLAFLLLMLVFRSILVPLTATLGFLLSVLATLGATVLIFQEGHLGLVEGQPLVSFMPIIVIGIVFGLAMDYQVFLVTRMREAYVHGATAREAVVDGFRHSARVVTAAATIMISVFAAFMLQDNSLIQSIGFALAAAVFFDAFVVRMVLIPSLMYLMGDAAWWLPAWLDRLLPRVDVEGEGLLGRRVADDASEVEDAAAAMR